MKYFTLFFFLFISTLSFSQNDCVDALVVCGNSGYTDLTVTGIGTQELNGSNVCSSQENNSIWLKVTIKNGGTLGFKLTPNSSSINEDFDFFIFGPNATCSNIGQAIRCSTTNPNAASQGNNLTGMNSSETDTSEGPGVDGNSFVKWLDVLDGESYFLVIDRPIGTSNFSIDWNGTATFSEQPTFDIPTATALNLEECDTNPLQDEKSKFDLTINNSAIGSQSNIVPAYFTSNSNALTGLNPIPNPSDFENTSNPQSIYMRLTNSVTECFNTFEFSINVKTGVSTNPPKYLIGCDLDNDGFYNFDLSINDVINPDLINNSISYYDSETNAANKTDNLSISYTNKNAFINETIWARVENIAEGCYSLVSFEIEIASLPAIKSNFTFKQCDEDGTADGITNFNLNEANEYLTLGDNTLNVSYFLTFTNADSGSISNTINPTPFSNNTQSTVFARIENTNGCYRVAQVNLLVSSTHFDANYVKTVTLCDNDAVIDGLQLFDLTENDTELINALPTGQNLSVSYYRTLENAQLEENVIDKSLPYQNETSFNQTLFVRVESNDNGECFGLGPHLQLVVHPRPEFELDTSAVFCQNLPPKTIETYNSKGDYTYVWTNETGDIISTNFNAVPLSEGEYTVVATSSFECESFEHKITLIPSIIASISENDISIVDDSKNNSIAITTTNLGIGEYEFSLDNEFYEYQDEPFFDNVSPGIHTVYIQDKNNCGIAKQEVAVIGYPKFFTPNGDGINDTWQVLGVNENFYAASNIYIFDRFGKLITQIDPKSDGWNGLFNGMYLPSTDYWFSVELIDSNGNARIRKGHFSLIRK